MFFYIPTKYSLKHADEQPENFHGRGGLKEQGHFDIHFINNTQSKSLPGKVTEFFSHR